VSKPRAYGSGQLYVKHGAYFGRWRTVDGRRLNRRIGKVREPGSSEGLTKTQAERAFRKLQEEEERRPRPAVEAARQTVNDAADSLRRRLALDGARKSYLEGCESMQRVHISPAFGDKPLERVTRADVEALGAAMLAKGRAPKTARNVLKFLHSVFEHAIDERWCRENPVRQAHRRTRRRPRDTNPDLQFLSVAELEAVIRAIPDKVVVRDPAPTRRGRPGSAPPPSPDVLGPVLRVLIRTAAMIGLRQSELLGLRWRDVDWQAQRVRVRNPYVRGEFSPEGKSDLSTRRSVPMADRIVADLDQWSRRSAYRRRRSRLRPPPEWPTARPQQGQQALQASVSRRQRPPRTVPRPAPHIRHAPREVDMVNAAFEESPERGTDLGSGPQRV
jgi:integrase